MAVGMHLEIPGESAEFYDKVMAELDWQHAEKPAGFISHYAGPSADGWFVFDVWESQAAFEQFAGDRLMAAVGRAAGGEPPNLQPVFIPIHFQDHAAG